MASDRIAESKQGGIIAFVLNGGFIDSKSADGFRKTIAKEFNHQIYCYEPPRRRKELLEKSRNREGGGSCR